MLGVMLALAPAYATGPNDQTDLIRFTFTEYHMGISARIVLYAKSEEDAQRAGRAAFERIADLESKMSDYRPDSEVMRLCQRPGEAVKVSPELLTVLRRADAVSRQTNGGFDVTVGPLIQLWRQARKDGKLPSPQKISDAKKAVGWRMIAIDGRAGTVKLQRPGMRIDLGGIAKGYAGDEALRVMRKEGISRVLIEMGGDIVLGDAPPGTSGWKISVPNAASPGFPAEMTIKNCAISTSGDTEQFVEIGGKRYSHIVDPKTGYGLTSRVQATVIAPDGLTSDPLSTAMTMLSEPARTSLMRNYRTSKVFVKIAL